MVSLAESILLQRIGKVTNTVNAKILAGLASLMPLSSEVDCKSIFEAFVKMSAEAAWQDDQVLLNAVGPFTKSRRQNFAN